MHLIENNLNFCLRRPWPLAGNHSFLISIFQLKKVVRNVDQDRFYGIKRRMNKSVYL